MKSTAQYELFDVADKDQFNTGLRTANGRRKPAWAAFRLALVATRRGSRSVEVWGWLKPGSGRELIEVRGRRPGGGGYRVLRRVRTNTRGMFRVVHRGRQATRLIYRLRHRSASGEIWRSRRAAAGKQLRYRVR